MKTLLHIDSSLRSDAGESSRLARLFVEAWREHHPDGRILTRDLARDPVPHLDAETFDAFATQAGQNSAAQQAKVALSNRLIGELESADVIVLAAPMYNFQLPSTLKAYFDHVARAGLTFRYTESGSVGLLTGKKAYVITTRGGVYGSGTLDTQTPYLRSFLGFLGIDDVSFVHAEGLALGDATRCRSLARAAEAIRALHAEAALAA